MILAILLINTITVPAQYYSYSDNIPDQRNILQFGVKVGVNNSNLYDTKGQDFVASPIFGPVFGGFLSIPLDKYIGIQTEVLYSAKGYAGSGTIGPEESTSPASPTGPVKGNPSPVITGAGSGDPDCYSFIDRMNYLDVPIMLQLKPLSNIYLLGGVEYSYLLSRSYTFTQNITTETTQQQFQNDNIRHNTFGVISGIGLILNRSISLDGRVAWDEQDNNGNGTSELPRYRNFWGQVASGFEDCKLLKQKIPSDLCKRDFLKIMLLLWIAYNNNLEIKLSGRLAAIYINYLHLVEFIITFHDIPCCH